MDLLWATFATAAIAAAGYLITAFVIHPIRNLQDVRSTIFDLMGKHANVSGIASDSRKYQAHEAFRQSASQLDKASASVPLYWLWETVGLVPTRQSLDRAKTALRALSSLSVQIIDHQPDLTKRRAERAQVSKKVTQQEDIVKASLRLKKYIR